MIPCICVFEKKDNNITTISDNEILSLNNSLFQINWKNEGTIYKNFPKSYGDKVNSKIGIMYSTKINVGQSIKGNVFGYSAFNFVDNGKMNYPMRINDYREIQKKDINDVFYINNGKIQISIIKEIDFYDGWFSYDDTLFICLAQIGIYPLS